MTSELLVRSVRRHGDHQIHYLLDRRRETCKLTLFHESPLSAALVTDEKDVPLAVLLVLPRLALPRKPELPERRLLSRFGVKEEDDFTTRVLQPTLIRSLPLPAAQKEPPFKNSADFALNRTGPEVVAVDTTPLPAHAIAKDQSLEDQICNPSLHVKMNSALNACFRALCDFIKASKKGESTIAERQKVAAYCFGQGDAAGAGLAPGPS